MAVSAELSSDNQASSLAFLLGQNRDAPFGSLTVEPDGGIRRSDPPMPFNFGFTFGGRPFVGKATSTPQGIRIDIDTLVGSVPYSVEDASRRDRIARLLTGLAGAPIRAKICDSQSIRVGLNLFIPQATTPSELIAAIVTRLLDARPYLDLVTETVGPATH